MKAMHTSSSRLPQQQANQIGSFLAHNKQQHPSAARRTAARQQTPTCQASQQQRQKHQRSSIVASAVLLAQLSCAEMLQAATLDANGEQVFEPQFNPGLLVVALFAATPPILFWGRIFLSAQRRDREIKEQLRQEDEKQAEREELKRKLFGDK